MTPHDNAIEQASLALSISLMLLLLRLCVPLPPVPATCQCQGERTWVRIEYADDLSGMRVLE